MGHTMAEALCGPGYVTPGLASDKRGW